MIDAWPKVRGEVHRIGIAGAIPILIIIYGGRSSLVARHSSHLRSSPPSPADKADKLPFAGSFSNLPSLPTYHILHF